MTFIDFQSVSLQFPYHFIHDATIKRRLTSLIKPNSVHLPKHRGNVIDDLSFNIKGATRLGIIGRNGAGKSTVLKLISGIYPPTRGQIHLQGKVNSLINLSLGMNTLLNGYENMIHKGLLLGLRMRDIKKRMEWIADFCDLKEHLNFPIHTYSWGMVTRLAASISLAIESDIYLLDEVFGTLDIAFINKFHKHFNAIIDSSAISIFVSHSIDIINRFCEDVVWLEAGKIKAFGKASNIIQQYLQHQMEG